MRTIICKVILCGDYSVGKTTFVQLFMGGDILGGYKPTIGADIGKRSYQINDHTLLFQIWDLSGQESFQTVRRKFYSRSDGAILVYDVSRRESYRNIDRWKAEVFQVTGTIPIVLVGNKIDLRSSEEDCVNTTEGESLRKKLSNEMEIPVPFVEASAIHKQNNLEPFIQLGELILQKYGVK